MSYTLPALPYDYAALEPHIDATTMQIHHTKHHQAYIDKVNAALAGTTLEGKPIEEVIQNMSKLPEDKQKAVRNNGGGHYNHSFFWTLLSSEGGEPEGELLAAINDSFGNLDTFKTAFAQAGVNQFGSGWAWLTFEGGKLHIESTPNQDSPMMNGVAPILGLDVWEHAYYLKYQNKRPDYIAAFWNVVNWKEVAKRFAAAQ